MNIATNLEAPAIDATLLLIPLGPGEVLDRLTVLTLKAKAAHSDQQRFTIALEQHLLAAEWERRIGSAPQGADEWDDLLATNGRLWGLEDDVRDAERREDFGPAFVAAARAIYLTNDRRAQIKRIVNDRLGSSLCDFKFHEQATGGGSS